MDFLTNSIQDYWLFYLSATIFLWAIIPAILFVVTNNKEMATVNMIAELKILKLLQNILLSITFVVLALAIFVHGVLFHTADFIYLNFGVNSRADEYGELYVTQLAAISWFIVHPYVYSAKKILSIFKTKMFSFYSLKNDFDIEHRNDQRFVGLDNLALISDDLTCDCNDTNLGKNDKKFKELTTDDIIYIKNKNVFVVEAQVRALCQEYYKGDKSEGWSNKWTKDVFSGLVFVLPKKGKFMSETFSNNNKTKHRSGNLIYNIFKINNDTQTITTTESRKKIRHGFWHTKMMEGEHSDDHSASEAVTITELNKAKKMVAENSYENHNPEINKIALEFNCDWVIETNTQIYLFHSAPNIDFFTFYTNKSVEENIKMFHDDMELISKAIKRLPDRKR